MCATIPQDLCLWARATAVSANNCQKPLWQHTNNHLAHHLIIHLGFQLVYLVHLAQLTSRKQCHGDIQTLHTGIRHTCQKVHAKGQWYSKVKLYIKETLCTPWPSNLLISKLYLHYEVTKRLLQMNELSTFHVHIFLHFTSRVNCQLYSPYLSSDWFPVLWLMVLAQM